MSETLEVERGLRQLIVGALGTRYKRRSSTGGQEIPTTTSSRYQTVDLGDFRTSGVRSDRAWLLDSIDFKDKRVLDLGSNLGEMSRSARDRGACLVDGFEADPYFCEISDLVNVFAGATRVSFYQRDISDPSSYQEHYDIVLALAVFTYIKGCLSRIAEIANVLVLETHRLKGNLDITYIKPISMHFPHRRILGLWDSSSLYDEREARAAVVFAKEKADLDAVLKTDGRHAAKNGRRRNGDAESRATMIDVTRTRLPTRFYFKFRQNRVKSVENLELDLDEFLSSQDAESQGYEGWAYWYYFLKGYLEYRQTKNTGPGNVYYDYLVDPRIDGLGESQELDPATASEYVARRFRDLDRLRHWGEHPDRPQKVAPVRAVLAGQRSSTPIRLFEVDKERPHAVRWLDGWHRILGATVFKVPRLRCELVREAEVLRPIRGAVDHLSLDGGLLQVRGWCLDPDEPIDCMELRAEGRLAGIGGMVERPDIGAAFEHIAHAGQAGFAIDCEHGSELDGLASFDLIPLREGLPVGRMRAHHLPGMFDGDGWPPEQLAERVLGASESDRLGLTSLNTLQDMLEPVGRFRKLKWFYSVLDWGCGCGLLERFMRHFLTRGEVTGIDTDEEAIDWCRKSGPPGTYLRVERQPPTNLPPESFDLVLGYDTLPRLDREAQRAWLAEIRRLLTHGGYAALSVYGELMLPFLTDQEISSEIEAEGISDRAIREGITDATPFPATYQTKAYSLGLFGAGLDVVAYIEGGVNNQQDLIVLRKN